MSGLFLSRAGESHRPADMGLARDIFRRNIWFLHRTPWWVDTRWSRVDPRGSLKKYYCSPVLEGGALNADQTLPEALLEHSGIKFAATKAEFENCLNQEPTSDCKYREGLSQKQHIAKCP